MKRTLFILLASTLLFSCRKEYTCECEDLSGDGSTRTIKARTHTDAVRKCEQNPAHLLELCVLMD